MIYDGYDLSKLLSVENIDRPILPEISVEADDKAGDGSRVRRVRLASMEIGVDVRLSCPKYAMSLRKGFDDLKRELGKRLLRRKPCKLILDDRPDVYGLAVLSGTTDLTKLVHTQTARLQWYFEDPVGHSVRGGDVSSDGGTIECYIDGNYPTAPVIEFQSEHSNDAILIDGYPMRSEKAPAESGLLVFDCANRKTTKDGVTVQLNLEDDYAQWEPGSHYVSCDRPFRVRWENLWVG